MRTLSLPRPLTVLDCEATSTDANEARLVEFAWTTIMPTGETRSECHRVNPGIPIPAASTAVHHITDADVANAPTFKEFAPRIAIPSDAILCGYNIKKYDRVLLDAEFKRAGVTPPWPTNVTVLDVLEVFRKVLPHSLTGAVRHFLHRDHAGAHTAGADVEATSAVLWAMVDQHPDAPTDAVALAAWAMPEGSENHVDPDGKLARTPAGIAINFGAHKGRTLTEMAAQEAGYLRWIISKDFSPVVKDACTAALNAARTPQAQNALPGVP